MKFLKPIESTLVTGTAPLSVLSTTLNNNLNADLLDGQHGAYYNSALNLTNLDISGIQLKHGFPTPYEVTLSYNGTTRQITLTPTGSTFDIWLSGIKLTKTGAQTSPAHANTTGNYFVVYGPDGNLSVSSTVWDILGTGIPVAYIYYNSTLAEGVALFELHTAKANRSWHKSQHFAIGTFIRSGFEISGYTLNTDTDAAVTFGLATGIVIDEDIERTNSALSDNGPYTIFRRTGASDWTWTTTNTVPYLSGTYIQYNQNSGGSYVMTDLPSARWVNYYVFVTTAIDDNKQILIIPGQALHTSLTLAQSENTSSLAWGGLEITEMAAVWKLTYETKVNYGSTGKVRLVEVSRLTQTKAQLSGNFSIGSHGALTGCDAVDSHPASAITNIPAGNISATDVQAAINELDSEKLSLTGGTLTGQLVSTSTYNAVNGGGNIYLNSATGNRIDYANVGIGPPAYTTRSAGTKIVLYPALTTNSVDYAFGIANNTLWNSVSNNGAMFKWYAGTTEIATLLGTGALGLGTGVTVSAKLHSLATTEQLRLGYDATKYASFTVDSSGNLSVVPTGGLVNITGSMTISSLTSQTSITSSDNILIQKNSETELKKISLNDLDNLISNTESIIASENLITGDFVNIWNDSGTQKVRKSDATVSGKETSGFVLSSFTSGQSALIFLDGINNQCSGLIIGTRYYLSTTPGTITNTPSIVYGSGNVLQYIGTAINTTELIFEPDDGVIL